MVKPRNAVRVGLIVKPGYDGERRVCGEAVVMTAGIAAA